ncbi:hypothetical protein [Kitasatospora sp. NPDC018619]|uniref:hypothetical protein n=1 Tax=unclassified Kitasatospora TaxID=2633591 RepID=UPI0037968B58
MSATPRHRSDEAERDELARLLPAPAAPELPRGRLLLLKEHLVDSITDAGTAPGTPRRTPRRRSLLLGAALPLGLAAALAGVLLTTGTAGSEGSAPGDDSGRSLGRASGVAYTLESEEQVVRLTILEDEKPVDADQLQRDIDRFGIRARVYAGEPGCRAAEPERPPHVDLNAGWEIEHDQPTGPLVLTVRPRLVPAGTTVFVYLPLATSDPANSYREMEAGLMKAPGPACMPARVFDDPLARLFPTPPAK